MPTLVDVLKKTEGYFRERGIPSPRLEAELLMASVLNKSRVALYLAFDQPLTEAELAPLRTMVRRRGQREPIAWILGTWGFYESDFLVHTGVLVPRPDTEALVEAVLDLLPAEQPATVADIGCGSGCIGLSVALKRPQAQVLCVDKSPQALACTQANVAHLDLSERVTVLEGSLLDPIPATQAIDVIVSNPPYIATAVLETLEPEVRQHEPRLALDGGADGLDVYRTLIPAAAARARTAVCVEIGAAQGDAVRAIFTESGLVDVQVRADLNGNDRVVCGRVP